MFLMLITYTCFVPFVLCFNVFVICLFSFWLLCCVCVRLCVFACFAAFVLVRFTLLFAFVFLITYFGLFIFALRALCWLLCVISCFIVLCLICVCWKLNVDLVCFCFVWLFVCLFCVFFYNNIQYSIIHIHMI